MSDQPPADVLGSLPRTRPHRRSQKRAALPVEAPAPPDASAPALTDASAPARAPGSRASAARRSPRPKADRLRQPPQPQGTPSTPRPRSLGPPSGADILGTAFQAAGELAEIGLSASARAIRAAVSRLPRP